MALVPSSCRHPVFTPSAAGDQFHALGFYSLAQIALGRAVRDSEPRHQITGALFSADDIGGGGRPPLSHEVPKNGEAALPLLLHGRRVGLRRAPVRAPDPAILPAAPVQPEHAICPAFSSTALP